MLKKFLIGTFALALMLTVASSASAFSGATLKQGSKGADVAELQAIVGVTVDSSFGPMTAAAVKAWQASHGLVADGIVGPKTQAAMAGSPVVTTTPGCPAGAMYNSMTGAPCTTVTSTVPGCVAGAMYSSTTGAKCDGATTPVVTGPLAGISGEITEVNQLSQYSAEEVAAGQSDVKVMGFEIKASKDGDIGISSVKLTFDSNGNDSTDSDRLSDYLKSVSILQGSTKVGSADVADFTKDSTGVYSKTFVLSSSVVRSDTTEKFYVVVDAVSNLDSGDIDSDSWTVGINNIRYVDGGGVTTTIDNGNSLLTGNMDYDTAGDGVAISFVSYATAADTELKISTASSSPKAQVVKVDTTSQTKDVVLLKGTLKLTGDSDAWLDELPITLTSTGDSIDALTGSVSLTLGGNTYTESTGANCVSTCASNTTSVLTFDNLDFDISTGSTVDFTVMAEINDIENSGVTATDFDEGDSLTASLTTTNRAAIVVENSQGDQLTDSTEVSGSAIGEAQTFRSEGVNVVMGSVSYDNTVDSSGNITTVTYTIPVSVTAFGDTLYLGQSAQLAATATASNAFAVVFQNSSAPTTSDTAATASFTVATSNATIESNGYRLDDGVTKNFTITVVLTTPTTASNSYRVALKQIRTFTDSGLGLGALNSSLTPVESYQTGYKFITS